MVKIALSRVVNFRLSHRLFLLGFETARDLLRSPLAGQFWENHVLLEMLKHWSGKGRRPRVWFWRTRSGEEVDLVIEQSGRVVACRTPKTYPLDEGLEAVPVKDLPQVIDKA